MMGIGTQHPTDKRIDHMFDPSIIENLPAIVDQFGAGVGAFINQLMKFFVF